MKHSSIVQNDATSFPCTSCEHGRLLFCWETFVENEVMESKKLRASDDGWNINEYFGVFSVHLKCNICEHTAYCVGNNFYDISDVVYDDMGCPDIKYEMVLSPQFFTPPLHYIKIPEQCPQAVKSTLIESFYVAPSCKSAAANRIRVSIEYLLDALNVPKTKSLHSRIDKAGKANNQLSSLRDAMEALKWIGNEGSHAGTQLSPQNIDVAYEILSHILNELYAPKSTLASTIREINNKRGIT